MAPKKKGGKKQADDWEDELGETPDPIAQATLDAKTAETNTNGTLDNDGDADGVGSGGLLAALRKNKDKRKKKGKFDQNDFVEGEDLGSATPPVVTDLNLKAPEEATFDDHDEFAATATKKVKGGRKDEPPATVADEDDGQDQDEAGGVKSKKEKEKEKKEREKQRKKEQVCLASF